MSEGVLVKSVLVKSVLVGRVCWKEGCVGR